MPPRSPSRSYPLPWLCLVLGSLCGFFCGSPWLRPAAAQTPDGGLPTNLGRDEIRCDAAGCSIGGCLLRQLERNPGRVLGQARFVPQAAEGRVRGLRLYAVHPESLVARLGLQNGDTLLSVSGYDLASPDSALSAVDLLRSADSATLTLEREGRPMTRVLRFDRRPLDAASCPLPPPAATETAHPPHSSPPVTTPSDAETLRAIAKDLRCVNNRCTLRRATVDRVLTSATLVARSVRIVPVVKDGQPRGFKLFAIRPGSVPALFGLRNGDLVRSFNGMDLSTPDRALQAYSMLRTASEVKLELERAGAPLVLSYVIKQ